MASGLDVVLKTSPITRLPEREGHYYHFTLAGLGGVTTFPDARLVARVLLAIRDVPVVWRT